MLILAIDTATDVLSVALAEDDSVLGESTLDAHRSHLELLLPEIHGILGAAGCQAQDVNKVVVGTGPGTFSGLRVGIATARGLAQALAIPLRGSSTLRAQALGIADRVCKPGDLILPLIDAKRGQVFFQLYKMEAGGGVVPESGVSCMSPGNLVKNVEADGKVVSAAGNGALAYYDLFRSCQLINLPANDDESHKVRAVSHLLFAEESKSFEPLDMTAVLPAYFREPDADVTVLERKKNTWLK